MSDTIERIYKLTVQADQAVTQIKKVGAATESIEKQLGGVGTALKTVFAGVTVGAAIAAFRNIADEMDKIGKASQKLGVSAESLSTLGYAAKASGSSFDSLAGGLKNLNKNLVDVEKGSSDAAKAMRSLGVTGADSPEAAFKKIADGLSQIPDGATKTAAALAIFGKSAEDLIPLLNEGAGGIADLEEKAARLGVALDGDAVKQATAFNDALDDMSTATRGIATQITIGMMPAVSGIAEEMAKSAQATDDWQSFGQGLGMVLKGVAIVGVNVAYVFSQIGKELGGLAAQAAALASGDFEGFKAIRQAMVEDSEQAKKNVDALTERLWALDTSFKAVATTAETKTNPALAKALKAALATAEKLKATKASKAEKTPLERFEEQAIAAQAEADLLIPKLEKLQELFFKGAIDDPTFTKLKEGLGVVGDAAAETVDPIEELRQSLLAQEEVIKRMPEEQTAIEELWQSGAISATTYAKAMKDIGISVDELAGPEAVEGVKELNQAIANGLQQGISGLIDVIFDADASFQEFAANFLKSMAKMIAQTILLNSIKKLAPSIFGSAHGNAFSGATGLPHGIYPANNPVYFPMGQSNAPLTRFANGGTVGVLAEAGRSEAIVPLMRHGDDLGVKASPVNIAINNQASEAVSVSAAETQQQDGSRQIDILVRKIVKQSLGDGSVDRVMRNNFGISRVPG